MTEDKAKADSPGSAGAWRAWLTSVVATLLHLLPARPVLVRAVVDALYVVVRCPRATDDLVEYVPEAVWRRPRWIEDEIARAVEHLRLAGAVRVADGPDGLEVTPVDLGMHLVEPEDDLAERWQATDKWYREAFDDGGAPYWAEVIVAGVPGWLDDGHGNIAPGLVGYAVIETLILEGFVERTPVVGTDLPGLRRVVARAAPTA